LVVTAGVSTFTSGPVLVGTATSTGTASQTLQVTGGAYVSGNLGIGTTNPGNGSNLSVITNTTTKLDVRGKTLLWNQPNVGYATEKSDMDTYAVLKLRGHASDSTNMQFAHMNSAMGVQVTNAANNANWDILLNPFGGNLGIGTVSPSAKLDVEDNNSSGYIAEFRQKNTSNTAQILIDSPTNGESRPVSMDMSRAGVLQWSIGQAYNDTNQSFHIATSALQSGNTGSKLCITSSGNLGIGTASPAKKLHVQTSFVSGAARGGGFTQTLFESNQASATYWEFQANASSTNDILFSKSNTGSYGIVGYDHSTEALRFHSNSAERMRIDSSGRVTKPYQPFVAGGSASSAISGNNNHVWATSGYVWSNVGNHWNASTGRFTAPVDGVYQVTAAIRYSSVPVTPSLVYIYFLTSYQSASGQPILLWSPQTESGGTYRPRILTAAIYMRANDYVEPRLYVTGGTISIDGGGTSQSDCFLNIYLLG